MRLQALLEEDSLRQRALKFQQLVIDAIDDVHVKLAKDSDQEGEFIRLEITGKYIEATVYVEEDYYMAKAQEVETDLCGADAGPQVAFDTFYPDCMSNKLMRAMNESDKIADIDTKVKDGILRVAAIIGDVTASVAWDEDEQKFRTWQGKRYFDSIEQVVAWMEQHANED